MFSKTIVLYSIPNDLTRIVCIYFNIIVLQHSYHSNSDIADEYFLYYSLSNTSEIIMNPVHITETNSVFRIPLGKKNQSLNRYNVTRA